MGPMALSLHTNVSWPELGKCLMDLGKTLFLSIQVYIFVKYYRSANHLLFGKNNHQKPSARGIQS